MSTSISILIVDDELQTRIGLEEILQMCGYQVKAAASGKEALEYLQSNKADLVLCDIKMPEMDGFELLHLIKQEHPGTKVVMITGNGDMGSVRKSFRMGADEFITKPVNSQELSLIIERVCWHLISTQK